MEILDILILGSGPASLCLSSELAKQDLNIKGISTKSPNEKWENTYGICASELEELVVTDSIKLQGSSPKIKVASMSELFAKAIRKIHDNESISSLFVH